MHLKFFVSLWVIKSAQGDKFGQRLEMAKIIIFLPICIGSLSITHGETAPLCRRDTLPQMNNEG